MHPPLLHIAKMCVRICNIHIRAITTPDPHVVPSCMSYPAVENNWQNFVLRARLSAAYCILQKYIESNLCAKTLKDKLLPSQNPLPLIPNQVSELRATTSHAGTISKIMHYGWFVPRYFIPFYVFPKTGTPPQNIYDVTNRMCAFCFRKLLIPFRSLPPKNTNWTYNTYRKIWCLHGLKNLIPGVKKGISSHSTVSLSCHFEVNRRAFLSLGKNVKYPCQFPNFKTVPYPSDTKS